MRMAGSIPIRERMKYCKSITMPKASLWDYPFGLRFSGASSLPAPAVPNDFLYNGKQLHDALGLGMYAYGFRWYDPAMSRFVSVDPIADSYYYLTPYQYAGNTPIWATDLDGLEPGISMVEKQ